MLSRFLLLSAVMAFLFFPLGCGKQVNAPQSFGHPEVPLEMPMMREDPRTIKFVEGKVVELSPGWVIVHTKKNVTLKFKMDAESRIFPKGEKLVPGTKVKIEIDHLPRGMRAKSVTVL